jgi:hypothetical protein
MLSEITTQKTRVLLDLENYGPFNEELVYGVLGYVSRPR